MSQLETISGFRVFHADGQNDRPFAPGDLVTTHGTTGALGTIVTVNNDIVTVLWSKPSSYAEDLKEELAKQIADEIDADIIADLLMQSRNS